MKIANIFGSKKRRIAELERINENLVGKVVSSKAVAQKILIENNNLKKDIIQAADNYSELISKHSKLSGEHKILKVKYTLLESRSKILGVS